MERRPGLESSTIPKVVKLVIIPVTTVVSVAKFLGLTKVVLTEGIQNETS